jgi:hypothetical protein
VSSPFDSGTGHQDDPWDWGDELRDDLPEDYFHDPDSDEDK